MDETELIFAEEIILLYEDGTLGYSTAFQELKEIGLSASKARMMLNTVEQKQEDW